MDHKPYKPFKCHLVLKVGPGLCWGIGPLGISQQVDGLNRLERLLNSPQAAVALELSGLLLRNWIVIYNKLSYSGYTYIYIYIIHIVNNMVRKLW